MMSQVKISVDPSMTGPTRFPLTSSPRSSIIMALEGGTEIRKLKIRYRKWHEVYRNSGIVRIESIDVTHVNQDGQN